MRKALDALYGAALFGACLAMVVIAVMVLVQVFGRIVDRIVAMLGFGRLGFAVPSIAEIGGFLFVASAFLALPYTLRAAGHVRVTLGLGFIGPKVDRVLTTLVLTIALGLTAFAAWAVALQTLASYERGSVSYGLIAIPLWLPQAVMTAGIVIFAIALLDELLAVLSGGEAAFRQAERQRAASDGGH